MALFNMYGPLFNMGRPLYNTDGQQLYTGNGPLFQVGGYFPDWRSIERIAKYKRFRKFFDGKQAELINRANSLLADTPHADKLMTLYTAVNIIDPLTTKPADMMFGEPPNYRSGNDPESPEQKALERIVEENDLNTLGWELVVGAGIRGDAWIKVYYDYREDFSELTDTPEGIEPEVIIEAVPAEYVFPEESRGNKKKFKAINIAWVEWVLDGKEETPYLNVERHIPGYIQYERFRLGLPEIDTRWDVPVEVFSIVEKVPTLRELEGKPNLVETGLNWVPIHHIPYKSVDDTWQGKSNIEPVEPLLIAIDERLTQIDYILWKHADPTAYMPEEAVSKMGKGPGQIIGLNPGDPTPGFMEWNSQLEAAFKELDRLIGMVFSICETPQWIFGSTITEMDAGGTGTSHTDGTAIQMRFAPILTKVKRIRVHVDKALRDALWTAMNIEQYVREQGADIEAYEPVYPKILWKDGIPRNEKELAETMAIRTGNKPTLDRLSAIAELEDMDFEKAKQIDDAINADENRAYDMIKQNQPSVNFQEGGH